MNEEFERLVEDKCDNTTLQGYLGLIILFSISIAIIGLGVKSGFFPITIIGAIPIIAGFIIIQQFKGELKGGLFWVTMIKENPDNIIWIKPILLKHKVALVLTLFKEQKFQLLTKTNLKVSFTLDSESDQKVFFQGVKNYLPKAHIGFTEEINYLYEINRNEFIEKLKEKDIYAPISKFDV